MKPLGFDAKPLVGRPRGFTLMEITAAVTIIALLALILVPIVRSRVEESKIVAAQDDMASIEKAQMLAFADTGRYFRLQDLNRPAADPLILKDPSHANYNLQLNRVPQAQWNRQLTATEIAALARTWTGPQLAVHRFAKLSEMVNIAPVVSGSNVMISNGTNNNGPLLYLTSGVGTNSLSDEGNAGEAGVAPVRYPTDPWGNPYLFFGSGRITDPGVRSGALRGLNTGLDVVAETDFGTAQVISLGPDGLPGNFANSGDPRSYVRGLGGVGNEFSDDLVREF